MEIETLDNNGEKQNVLMFSPRNHKNVEYGEYWIHHGWSLVFVKWLIGYGEDNELKKCLSFMLDKNIIQQNELRWLYENIKKLPTYIERELQNRAQGNDMFWSPRELAMNCIGFDVKSTPNGTVSLMFLSHKPLRNVFWIETSLGDKQQALLHACFPIGILEARERQEKIDSLSKEIEHAEKCNVLIIDEHSRAFISEICMVFSMLSKKHQQEMLQLLGSILQ